MSHLLDRLRGRPLLWDLGSYRAAAAGIERSEAQLRQLDDRQLREKVAALRRHVEDGEPVAPLTNPFFALYREAARRTLGLRPFDEQIIAGLAMFAGDLAEMQTGEGKTLAAVAPSALHALAGRGAHVLTFNDYLARRDAGWMGPVYELLGLTVGVVQEGMSPAERRRAYAADVTYATAKEAGFDYLRGLLAREPGEQVQRPFHYAIVDEADSILIDEARVPLVIAGDLGESNVVQRDLVALAATLDRGDHYDVDEHGRNVTLNVGGLDLVERRLGCGDLLQPQNVALLTELHCALHARVLLHRDVDYIVREGRIELVDEFTGRVVEDRHLPDGLQAAVEAKEGLAAGAAGVILGSVTLQHFMARYNMLAGMTATARHSAEEFREFYGMRTVVVPPHRPSVRLDHPDRIFTHVAAKTAALVEEIVQVHASGRPLLVGTASVEESERLADDLRVRKLPCNVLNARRDEDEARIVAEAGDVGAVTISTNMAGRGTDIRLGGADESRRDAVLELGGLYVIGTNRHESVRIDDQLRGRAGRQGDPGSTRFFLSLEDPLIARFGLHGLIPENLRPGPQDDPVDHPVIRREIARAQSIADNENFEIRRTLSRYSEMVERQRDLFHGRREETLHGRAASMLEQAAPEEHRTAVERWGRAHVDGVEGQITLAWIDRLWREHLAEVADLRESIHLKAVARLDPLSEFQKVIIESFRERREVLEPSIVGTFQRAVIRADGVDLGDDELRAPSSTWTYIISDDPFRDQLMRTLGGTAMGLGIVANFPLVFSWWLYRRWRDRK
jgi:preprotein translocase subunit SecA